MTAPVTHLPNNKATRLRNLTCAYCGAADDPANPLTHEHVIGRRFVPKGSLASAWCLIVRACERCNNAKADLEDDISAITLVPRVGDVHEDGELAAIASRKAKGSLSRRTKKAVADSYEENKINGRFGPSVTMTFGLVAPPQLDPERVRRLAHFHLQGFFYLITYDEERRAGGFIPGDIGWLNEASREDWGNPVQQGFAARPRLARPCRRRWRERLLQDRDTSRSYGSRSSVVRPGVEQEFSRDRLLRRPLQGPSLCRRHSTAPVAADRHQPQNATRDTAQSGR